MSSSSTGTRTVAATVLTTAAAVTSIAWTMQYLQRRARMRAETSVERVRTSLPQNKPLVRVRVCVRMCSCLITLPSSLSPVYLLLLLTPTAIYRRRLDP